MNKEKIFSVLLGPHVSEKAARLGDSSDYYIFKVSRKANKLEIKNAVEHLFKVNVKSVRTLKVKPKVRRTRFGLGNSAGFKKAYVRLEQGEDIDFAVTS